MAVRRVWFWLLLAWSLSPGTAWPAAARYRVALITLDPGDQIFERFGHTALSIEDRQTPGERVYSFGTFDGDADYLWYKVLHKTLRYWVTSMSWLLMTVHYDHRQGQVQELTLDDAQAARLAQRLETNLRPENRDYVYDPFADNCVTRVRDLLNEASDGALLRHAAGPAPRTFRQEVLRTLTPVPLLAAVVTLLYGPYTDQPRRRWDTLFLPRALHDAVAEVQIGEGSSRRPLVQGERQWRGERFAPPGALPHPFWVFLVPGLALCYGLACLAHSRYRDRGHAVLGWVGALLALLVGSLGWALLYLQTIPYACFHDNQNLAFLSPLSLLAPPLFVLQALGRLRWAGQCALLVLLTWGVLLPVAHLLAFHVWGRCSQAHGAAMGWSLTADLVLLSIAAWSFCKLTRHGAIRRSAHGVPK